MAKIDFKGKMIVLSCSMNMEKEVFEGGADDHIFKSVKALFVQNGWSPISDLHHELDDNNEVSICLSFTVPQNDTTMSSQWLNATGVLMNMILFGICTIIDNNHTVKKIANDFYRMSVENGIVMLPAPEEEKKPEMQTLIIYSTGDNVKAFNEIMHTTYRTITKWPQGFEFIKLEKSEMQNLCDQLTKVGCEYAVK